MKRLEAGRTLIETLAVIAIIGILSVSGLNLYAKAMNTIRANYIMEQVYIKANELVENKVATRHRTADITMNSDGNLSYGYSIDTTATGLSGAIITVKLTGDFSAGLCKILKKKLKTQEYAGLNSLDYCTGESKTITFKINSNFKRTKKTTQYESTVYNQAKKNYEEEKSKSSSYKECQQGALSCEPLICNVEEGWYEFDDDPGKCQTCPAGYYCE